MTADLGKFVDNMRAIRDLRKYNRIAFFQPYPKQEEFFDKGALFTERLLMAANQVGKTEAGAYETACHLTGDYPDWWLGRRFDHPTEGWVAGETGEVVRDAQQAKLCGKPGVDELFGTGYIPKDRFVGTPSLSRGVPDAYNQIQVRHKSGGVSIATFKSYEQGRKKFQAASLHWLWLDEEPPMDVFSEAITRTNATGGVMYMTFTPWQGMTDVVMSFLDGTSPNRCTINMTIDDAGHMTPEKKAEIIAKYKPYEKEARTKGIPMLGSGRIFPYTDESITEATIPLHKIPPEWFKGWGVDFGIDHPFAASLCAIDRDTDCFHVLHTIRVSDQQALQHSVAIKNVAVRAPVFWPHDGHKRESDAKAIAEKYKNFGLHMWPEHATHKSGGYGVEAGLLEMDGRMTTGRFKVGAHLTDFFDEFHLYHRKDGVIVKLRDDIISSVRAAVMMQRHFKQVPLGGVDKKRSRNKLARGLDFDVFRV